MSNADKDHRPGGGMPAFGDQLTKQQISDVAAYVTQRIAKGNP